MFVFRMFKTIFGDNFRWTELFYINLIDADVNFIDTNA